MDYNIYKKNLVEYCNKMQSCDTCVLYEFCIKNNVFCNFNDLSEKELIEAYSQLNLELPIKIKYHVEGIEIKKIEKGDWIDLVCAETVNLKKGEYKLIDLGISMELPKGYEAHVVPRSSTFKRWGILQTNHMGVIDESYCGNEDIWKFPALATRDITISKGERICQFRIVKKMPPIHFIKVNELSGINRGGFGSTGK